MDSLGIAHEAVAAGYPQSGLTFQDLHGNVLMDIPGIGLAGPGYPTDLGMGRPALHGVLIAAADASARVCDSALRSRRSRTRKTTSM